MVVYVQSSRGRFYTFSTHQRQVLPDEDKVDIILDGILLLVIV